MTSRFLTSVVSAAALLAIFAVADASRADASNASRSTTASAHTTLPPIVPLGSLLGMSAAAGLLGVALSKKSRA